MYSYCNIMWFYQSFVAVGFLGSLTWGAGVETWKSACLSEGQLYIECPENHVVVFRTAKYLRSRREGCITTTPDRCAYADMKIQLAAQCIASSRDKTHTCTLDFDAPKEAAFLDRCLGYDGDPYLEVSYTCSPVLESGSNMFDMCTEGTWTHSSFLIHSPQFPRYTKLPVCSCTIALPSETYVEVKVAQIKALRDDSNYTSSQVEELQGNTCPMSLQFWTEEKKMQRCCEDPFDLKDIEMDVKDVLWLQFENFVQLKSYFTVAIRVHHAETMVITCGPNAIPSSIPTTTSFVTTTTTTTTATSKAYVAQTREGTTLAEDSATTETSIVPGGEEEPEENGSKDTIKDVPNPHSSKNGETDNAIWPLIAGGVGAAAVLIIVVVGLALFCRKKKRTKEQKKEGKKESDKYAHDNAVYMSNEQVVRVQGSRSNTSRSSSQQANGKKSNDRQSRSNNRSSDRGPLPPINEKYRDISPSRVSTISEVPSCDSLALPLKPGAEISFNTLHGASVDLTGVHVQMPTEPAIGAPKKEEVCRRLSVRDKIKLLESQQLE